MIRDAHKSSSVRVLIMKVILNRFFLIFLKGPNIRERIKLITSTGCKKKKVGLLRMFNGMGKLIESYLKRIPNSFTQIYNKYHDIYFI